MGEITIRPLDECDSIEELTDLLHRAYAVLADAGFNFTACDQPPEETRRRTQRGECFVATMDGAVVGTVTVYMPGRRTRSEWYNRDDVARFGQFAVEPALQGKGIGRRLLSHVSDLVAGREMSEIALDTAEGATQLVRFYLDLGYRIIERVQWTAKTYQSLIMSKRLQRGARASSTGDGGPVVHDTASRMLYAMERAFGPGDRVTVYSEQRNEVADRLSRGVTHFQPWSSSAAYDKSMGREFCQAHKRGYFWMAREFKLRMGRPLIAAPVWLSFDYETMAPISELYKKRKAIEKIIALEVPRSELLLSMLDPWINRVLAGWCLDEEIPKLRQAPTCECTGARRRETWARIFDISATPADWQAVVDRIEPAWLTKIDGLRRKADG